MRRQTGRLIELQILTAAVFMAVVIFVAQMAGDQGVGKSLQVAAGADRDAKDGRGGTPRALAEESGMPADIAAMNGISAEPLRRPQS